MRTDQSFVAKFAVFSAIDLALLGGAELCPLCQVNPPVLRYHTGSGGVRDEGPACF